MLRQPAGMRRVAQLMAIIPQRSSTAARSFNGPPRSGTGGYVCAAASRVTWTGRPSASTRRNSMASPMAAGVRCRGSAAVSVSAILRLWREGS